ncbi:hypothetical protein [Enterobacter hormaechei]|uniref:hypothetical protein n=1 Tax=Enterobacter hormaechei TaxID=158836 RepID=UPI0012597F9C|nr:hypothetical protein [Enterobacter hormaechei]VAL22891.1 Uncharacterised protein [Enterobacter hormaechei]
MELEPERKESFEKWERLIDDNFHNAMLESATDGIVCTHEVFDKFSSWLLVGTGTTAALMIVNIDKIIPYVNAFGMRWGIILLTISAFLGFTAKVYDISASTAQVSVEKTRVAMMQKAADYQTALDKFDEIADKVGYKRGEGATMESFSRDFINLFPFAWLRNKIAKTVEINEKKRRAANFRAVHAVVYQSIAVGLQAFSYLLFLIITATSINFVS